MILVGLATMQTITFCAVANSAKITNQQKNNKVQYTVKRVKMPFLRLNRFTF